MLDTTWDLSSITCLCFAWFFLRLFSTKAHWSNTVHNTSCKTLLMVPYFCLGAVSIFTRHISMLPKTLGKGFCGYWVRGKKKDWTGHCFWCDDNSLLEAVTRKMWTFNTWERGQALSEKREIQFAKDAVVIQSGSRLQRNACPFSVQAIRDRYLFPLTQLQWKMFSVF